MRGARVLRCVAATGIVVLAGCHDDYQPRPEQPITYYPPGYYTPAPPPPPSPAEVQEPGPVVMQAPGAMMIPAPPPVIVQEPPSEPIVAGFYQELSPYGQWVVVGSYGRCWRPMGVDPAWRPYTVGRWAYADCGWTWVSAEPWGYATCHYGRWFLDVRQGWIWVPGSVWAPAWVAWRSGGGYIGWAPLGPSVGVEVNEYYTRSIPASQYCFVREREMVEPHISRHMVDARQNVTIINNTTNITHITVINNTVVNRSLSVEHVQRVTGRKVERARMRQVGSVDEARRDNEVAVYRPKALPPAAQLVPVPRREAISPVRPAQPQRPAAQPQPQPQVPQRVRPGREPVAPVKPEAAKPQETPRVQPEPVKPAPWKRPATAAPAPGPRPVPAPAPAPTPARNEPKPSPAKPVETERKPDQTRGDAAGRSGATQDRRDKGQGAPAAAPAPAPAPARNQPKHPPATPDETGRKADQARADAAGRGGAKQDRRDKADPAEVPGQREQGGPQDDKGSRGH